MSTTEICRREDCDEQATDDYHGYCSECCGLIVIRDDETKLHQQSSKTYALRMRRDALLDLVEGVSRPRTEDEEIELIRIEGALDFIYVLENPDYETAEAGRTIRNAAKLLRSKTQNNYSKSNMIYSLILGILIGTTLCLSLHWVLSL